MHGKAAAIPSAWPAGGGEMGERIRTHDWAATPLGPIEAWPQSLLTAVDMVLAMPGPATILWGPAHVQLYNDAYVAIARDRHPALLGRPAAEGWPDVFGEVIAPLLETTRAGWATQLAGFPVTLRAPGGRLEERAFDTAWSPVRDESGAVAGALQTLVEVTDRHRAEAALREGKERQAFLLAFSDALRGEPSADAVAERAIRMLSEQMQLDRCYLATYRLEDDRADITHQTGNDRVPPMPETIRLSDFPEAFRVIFDQTLVIKDVLGEQGLSHADKQNILSLGMRALLAPTLRKGAHRPLWAIVTVSAHPRCWTQGEIALAEEAAERTWAAFERARAEVALRASEERFRQFADASCDLLWVRDAETLQWEYLSPAFEAIYGLSRAEALAGDTMRNWADLIHPEDREAALAAIGRVLDGERVTFEYRIRRPSDGRVRWLRNTDFPMRDGAGRLVRVGGIGQDVTEEKENADRLGVLVSELQHRSRNLLSVVSSVANKTVGRGGSVESFENRLAALGRAQGQLSRFGSDTVEVEALVRAELEAHAGIELTKVVIQGPRVSLTAQQVQTFALALHELATNAVKYGALRDGTGRLAVTWTVSGADGAHRLALDWVESGVDVQPERVTRRGYGRELIERALTYSLRARTEYVLGHDGARCRIELPLA